MTESDSDADLADYAPSGLSQVSHTSESASKLANELPKPIKEVETPSHVTSDDILKRAHRFIDKIQVPDEITSADQLAWHCYIWKKAKYLNPVRIGSKDMIIGLNMPQSSMKLLPYGESDEWNPELLTEYLETLVEVGDLTELEVRKEELYLRKILKVVRERRVEHKVDKEPQKSFVASEHDVEPEVVERIPVSPSMTDTHKTEPLKAGDAIEYYRTISKAGDKDALTQAIILSVRPGNTPLKLHNDEVLPAGHSVKRIFTRVRGSFVDLRPKATYRSIRSFKLAHSELRENDSLRQLLSSTNSPLEAILERNFAAFEQKVKDDGCGAFMDMVAWKSKKTKSNGESVGQTSRKRAKVVAEVDANESLIEKDVDSGADEATAALQSQLTRIRSLSGRRRAAATHMAEDMLELAIQVREQLLSSNVKVTIDDLAKELNVSAYSLKHFLCGDEGKLVRFAQHEETKVALQHWVGNQRLPS
ncbi:hypothetical protein MHU86_7031 [Fragilaria crotonensis]|nr:hypothetical protein MHU86_7031 [Fragilaria crotonensis]